MPMHSSFNPRAREGRDAVRINASRPSEEVSIHAPVKGATQRIERPKCRSLFQSTRP